MKREQVQLLEEVYTNTACRDVWTCVHARRDSVSRRSTLPRQSSMTIPRARASFSRASQLIPRRLATSASSARVMFRVAGTRSS